MRSQPSFVLATAAVILAAGTARADPDACDGCKDLPYLTRMPNYHITSYDESQFNSQAIYDGRAVKTFEGHRIVMDYGLDEGKVRASALQITRNYANAFKKAGALQFQGECKGDPCGEWGGWTIVTGKLTYKGKPAWVMVEPHDDGNWYKVYAVEVEEMKQEVEALSASDMQTAIETTGRVALHVQFEADKAVLLPDATPTIEQIAKLLEQNPDMVLSIEGHTDNSGDRALAQKLSENRAKAVQAAIVAKGVDKGRLKTKGWGPTKPIADNTTDEGRAKNRRVELVRYD